MVDYRKRWLGVRIIVSEDNFNALFDRPISVTKGSYTVNIHTVNGIDFHIAFLYNI